MSPSVYCILPLAMALVACGRGDPDDVEEYIRQVKKRKSDPIAPLPAIGPIDAFSYGPEGRRDPFVPDRRSVTTIAAPRNDGILPDPLRRKEQLEAFPLDALTMVGTLARGGGIWALVMTPDRTLYRVSIGNHLGTHHGRITRITKDKIELTELISDDGAWRERPASLMLNR